MFGERCVDFSSLSRPPAAGLPRGAHRWGPPHFSRPFDCSPPPQGTMCTRRSPGSVCPLPSLCAPSQQLTPGGPLQRPALGPCLQIQRTAVSPPQVALSLVQENESPYLLSGQTQRHNLYPRAPPEGQTEAKALPEMAPVLGVFFLSVLLPPLPHWPALPWESVLSESLARDPHLRLCFCSPRPHRALP